jgi:hypothetical protein
MKRAIVVWAGAGALALACAGTARANVLNPFADKTLKPAQKLRADVAKQVAAYTFCLAKAAANCEKHGLSSHPECHLNTGIVDYEPSGGKNTDKFTAAITKCDAKINLGKKGFTGDYTAIGCPGDCNAAAPGTQECAGIAAFQALVTAPSASAVKGQLPLLAAVIDSACATDNPGKLDTDVERITCVADNTKALTKYAQGLFKCEGKCEEDFKDKIGNGGLDNTTACLSGLSAKGAFNACDGSALSKAGALSPTNTSTSLVALRAAINNATQGLYDRFDPTGTDADSPCGDCGNNTREGAEMCDGSDLGVCGSCKPDCTCGP